MRNIAVVAAHPDDEVLGCGGAIARHAHEGDRVHVIVVTRGMAPVFSQASVDRVRQELSRAHEILGVASVRFLDFPAPALDVTPGYQIADAIRATFCELNPDTVYFPHYGDIHGDHRAASLATTVAARPNGSVSVRRMLAYETLSETEWAASRDGFQPTVFVDISRRLEDKLKAMECYESQLRPSPHARSLEAVRALAIYRGHTINVFAAEAFTLVREIVTE